MAVTAIGPTQVGSVSPSSGAGAQTGVRQALDRPQSQDELSRARVWLAQSTDPHHNFMINGIKDTLNNMGIGNSVDRITAPERDGTGGTYVGDLKPGEPMTDAHRQFENDYNRYFQKREQQERSPMPRFEWRRPETS